MYRLHQLEQAAGGVWQCCRLQGVKDGYRLHFVGESLLSPPYKRQFLIYIQTEFYTSIKCYQA